jgi:hypothetical protein
MRRPFRFWRQGCVSATLPPKAALVALAFTGLALTACTSSHSTASSPLGSLASSPSAVDSLPSAVPDSDAMPSDSAALTSTPSPTLTVPTTPPSNAPAPVKSTPAGPQPCTSANLAVSAQSAGAASGQAFATLRFTNTGDGPCTLDGYPGVSLLLKGKALGGPATRSGAPAKTLTIAAQANVTAQLTDDTTCNAAQSDNLKVYAPNLTTSVQIPFVLRGCALVIAPVTAS